MIYYSTNLKLLTLGLFVLSLVDIDQSDLD